MISDRKHVHRAKARSIMAIAVVLTWCLSAVYAVAAQTGNIVIGGLFDLSGPTAVTGKEFAQGAVHAAAWINRTGIIDGRPITLLPGDHESDAVKAMDLYRRRLSADKAVAFIGWGPRESEALVPQLAKDQIVYFSAWYDGTLMDPEKAPFHFAIGSSYTDHVRMAVDYAKEQDKKKFCFIYPDNPHAKRIASIGRDYAKSKWLDLGPDVIVGLRETDLSRQIGQLKDFGADFAWVGGTTPSTVALLKEAARRNLETRFLINAWSMDENLVKLAGDAAEGRTLGFMTARPFGWDAPATADIRTMAGQFSYSSYYNQGWATMMVLWKGFLRAASGGPLTGPGIKTALETLENFEPGGLTPPLTYTAKDHRATTQCGLYEVKDGKLGLIADLSVERSRKYLGR